MWYMSLAEAERHGAGPISKLPYALRILAEAMLRREDGLVICASDISGFVAKAAVQDADRAGSVTFFPQRILFQDSAGLPVLADIAALMEIAGAEQGAVPEIALKANMVVDHAVEVDAWASPNAREANMAKEFERHASRYKFLKWCESRFPWLKVVPPGAGICHQINLEELGKIVVLTPDPAGRMAGCDSVLGTDSHTTMINAISVFGWGVGGIEATAALLGEPVVIPFPTVVGVHLKGRLSPGVTATDLALSLTAELRKHNLVQRFVEFFGDGMASLAIPDRATVANMAPEYGATMGFFPADRATIDYLRSTGRSEEHIALVEAFLKAQGLLAQPGAPRPQYSQIVEFDLGQVEPVVAGPSSPDQKLKLSEVPKTVPARQQTPGLNNGDVVIAAITSCTNTSNPRLLIAAALLARNAVNRGLKTKPWVKTSFAPGSRIASAILAKSGLQRWLDALGFEIVGFGCTTCMGNSGPLTEEVSSQIKSSNLSVAAVLSGNRNFPGRIHPLCRLSYLASPKLVVAYALSGSMHTDLATDPIGVGSDGRPVYFSDVAPPDAEVEAILNSVNLPSLAAANRSNRTDGSAQWQSLEFARTDAYPWEGISGFIRRPPFLQSELRRSQLDGDIEGARILLLLGDRITTDHISPVSAIPPDSEAGKWLRSQGVSAENLTSYSARRLNHDVMLRGGFANPQLQNQLAGEVRGGFTRLGPKEKVIPVHEAAAAYAAAGIPVVVVAGERYGAGSARDWAAKATRLLGIRAVIAESFERIHRTNLIAMGVLPLLIAREYRLALLGDELLTLSGVTSALKPHGTVRLNVTPPDRAPWSCDLECAIESRAEVGWLQAGGILPNAASRFGQARGGSVQSG